MKNNFLKLAMLILVLTVGFSTNAQTTDATDATLIKDAGDGVSVKIIDNKGTIKYLQTNNGITTITSTTAANKTVTTWQLGGTLTDNTYIDVDGNVFALDGIKLLSPTLTAGAATTASIATTATTLSSHGGTGTGWTVLIRDESTGETKKLLATNLVTAGRVEFPIATDGDLVVTATGLANGTSINKISVYRNGAKLRAGVDYTLTDDDEITLDISAVAPNDWTTYAGDIIEVQWIY
jgi:hypothetical protein